ncbi:hypothetical protein [Acholeplasma laidlawii]|uniref:hypothetical protein n=1 Tax=Acholeplasma laidlawii TaxID=2148 RepID=UPI0018C1D149|nr:hypothetical protein [Acholeplasma laidlawii]
MFQDKDVLINYFSEIDFLSKAFRFIVETNQVQNDNNRGRVVIGDIRVIRNHTHTYHSPYISVGDAGHLSTCSLGSKVTNFNIGDKVFGDLSVQKFGGYAEYAKANQKSIYHTPNNMDLKEVAGLPMCASTSLIAIDKVKLKKIDHILAYGASGAVGYTLSQILTYEGYKVTLVASKRHHSYLSKLKPMSIMDYNVPDFKLENDKYDVILQ